MLPTTRELLRASLRADPTLGQTERTRLFAVIDKPPEAAPPRLLRRREVATRLSLSLRAVDRLCKEGTLSKRVLPGRKRATGISENEVNSLIRGEVAHV